MKSAKIFTVLVLAVALAFSVTSCKKETCYVCTLDTDSQTLCEDDYPSVLGVGTFQPAIDALETAGYTCNKQ